MRGLVSGSLVEQLGRFVIYHRSFIMFNRVAYGARPCFCSPDDRFECSSPGHNVFLLANVARAPCLAIFQEYCAQQC